VTGILTIKMVPGVTVAVGGSEVGVDDGGVAVAGTGVGVSARANAGPNSPARPAVKYAMKLPTI